jgi:signal transduction histidine kinase
MNKPAAPVKSSSRQSLRELNLIIKISRNIIGTLDYEKVLQIISDGMSELLDIESAAMYILVNDDELLLGATTPPLDPQMPEELRRAFVRDHPHIKKAIIKRKPVLLADTKTSPLSPAERAVAEMRRLRSLIYFPFVQEDRVLGVLILGTCNKSRTFTRHETDLGQTVANQLSVAIQNTRLHADLKDNNDNLERLVEQRTKELETANRVLKEMNLELIEKSHLVLQHKEELETNLNYLKSVQLKLIQSEKMASLGVLTAGVAHEINNPLNFISGSYLGLEEFFATSDPEHKEQVKLYLDGLKVGIKRVTEIVHSLNQFSRDNNTYNEECNIHSIIDNCIVMLYNRSKLNIKYIKSYYKDGLTVKGNVGKLHQAFTNIILNSIQAIEDEGVITITTNKCGNSALIDINDTGKGIKEDDLPRITDPFFTTKDPNEGTGLGLSITYSIIKEHKGQIDFESELGKGTTVKISLPGLIGN